MGTQNWGYSKFGSTFNFFETILFIFSNFGPLKFVVFQICWYPKHVGTQKCGYNEITNLVGTQNWWQILRYIYFRDVTTQSLGT